MVEYRGWNEPYVLDWYFFLVAATRRQTLSLCYTRTARIADGTGLWWLKKKNKEHKKLNGRNRK